MHTPPPAPATRPAFRAGALATGLATALAASLLLQPAAQATASAPAAAAPPATAVRPAATAPRVLLVVSAEGRLDASGQPLRPGFDLEEFAQAWLVFRANGLLPEVASPAGGAVTPDRFSPDDELVRAIQADAQATAALAATRRTQDIRAGEHAAVFVVGGKGAMFDLPRDAALARLLRAHHAAGGVLAAVCHGPAALAAVTTPDGRPLVAGRRLTGFTDEEEGQFGKRWAQEYPFWLEQRLREQGARWEEAPLMMPKLVVDDRLITGQNPMSTALAAEAVVRALGRVPVAREPLREEASLQLVQHWLGGERTAARALLQAHPQRYKPDLIAMLGYYQHAAATDDAGRRQAVAVMELAEPHFDHPRFREALSKARAGLATAPR